MENSFLQCVTKDLYKKFGNSISEMKILLPNHRSILFFNEALSQLISQPIWQPKFVSIDELMCNISGLIHVDKIHAITELYKVYSDFHKTEKFDTFYFWGEILLNDFDSIDKYLIDADLLFKNIFELKSIENDLSYLTKEQVEVIKHFWSTFDISSHISQEKDSFLKIWRTLSSIYHKFKTNLMQENCGYTGMIQRDAAEKIISEKYHEQVKEHYAIIGFNALSKCEKILFDYLKRNHIVDFYWDYDEYYLKKEQEAGLFIRENLKRYSISDGFEIKSSFTEPKQISAIACSSDSLQCKYLTTFLQNIFEKEGKLDKNTAIVLADESLLIPVLYALPDCAEKINITMGYPLKHSLAYGFIERLFLLQQHIKKGKNNEILFYHSDVTGLLNHPYIMNRAGGIAKELYNTIIKEGRIYIPEEFFSQEKELTKIFTPVLKWDLLADYTINILNDSIAFNEASENKTEMKLQREQVNIISSCLTVLTNSLKSSNVKIETETFNSIARRILQSQRIPFSGEPLKGVQIMGILETRNLDFDNVIILSMNDDTFPSSRSNESSYIPYSLRYAYGIPTPEHHEGVYAYYFYRLLQRSKHIEMVYCTRNDDKSSGEQSRYIYQLEYESPHTVNRKTVTVDLNLCNTIPIIINKTKENWLKLNKYLSGEKEFSPSSFNSYLECPLKFYFRSIAGIKPENEITEEIDIPMFGTILHRAMELLYKPLIGIKKPQEHIRQLIGSTLVEKTVETAINENFYYNKHTDEEEYEGNVLMVRESVNRYINDCILPFDMVNAGQIIGVEIPLKCNVSFTDINDNIQHVVFSGKSDRIDLMPDNTIRIIDYKTGTPHNEFLWDSDILQNDNNQTGAIIQTFLYSMMVTYMQQKGELQGCDVCPSLYYVRKMNSRDFSPLLYNKNERVEVKKYSDYKTGIESFLRNKLKELFDNKQPFSQCENKQTCKYCDFIAICNRQS